MRKYLLNRPFVLALALWAAILGISPSNALALPSESLVAIPMASAREAQINQIMSVVSRPEAQMQLMAAGLSQSDVRIALAKLDDAQLASLSNRAEAVKAGGDVVGVVVALIVIAFLVVLLMFVWKKDVEIKDEKK